MGIFGSIFGGIAKGISGALGKVKEMIWGGDGVVDESTDFYEELLNAEKAKLYPLIGEAQERYRAIKEKNYYSTAIDYADSTGGGFSDSKVDLMRTIEEVNEERIRVEVFLKDETSTLEGALAYDGQIHASMGGISGGFDGGGDSELWEAYRKIAEINPAGIMSYGSDNLVNAMYNGVVHGHEAFEYGMALLENDYNERQAGWISVTSSLPFEW